MSRHLRYMPQAAKAAHYNNAADSLIARYLTPKYWLYSPTGAAAKAFFDKHPELRIEPGQQDDEGEGNASHA